MKKGFTMVELIFVIVILGILAAVAVPKLTATREDAQMVTLINNVKQAIKDIQAYYLANDSLPIQSKPSSNNQPREGVIIQNLTNVKFSDYTDEYKSPFGVHINHGFFYHNRKRCVEIIVSKKIFAENGRQHDSAVDPKKISTGTPIIRIGLPGGDEYKIPQNHLCREVLFKAIGLPKNKNITYFILQGSGVTY